MTEQRRFSWSRFLRVMIGCVALSCLFGLLGITWFMIPVVTLGTLIYAGVATLQASTEDWMVGIGVALSGFFFAAITFIAGTVIWFSLHFRFFGF